MPLYIKNHVSYNYLELDDNFNAISEVEIVNEDIDLPPEICSRIWSSFVMLFLWNKDRFDEEEFQ